MAMRASNPSFLKLRTTVAERSTSLGPLAVWTWYLKGLPRLAVPRWSLLIEDAADVPRVDADELPPRVSHEP